MKRFVCKILLFALFVFVLNETISRLFIDDIYYQRINTYQEAYEADHVDYLFIGSSTTAAAINAEIFKTSDQTVAVNAARGYSTPSIHYNALKRLVSTKKDGLKGTIVLLELSGSYIYEQNADYNYTAHKGMPHLLLPHINNPIKIFTASNNDLKTKSYLLALYLSSSLRTLPFIRERIKQKFVVRKKKSREDRLANEGGIRNDKLEKMRTTILKNISIEKYTTGQLLTTEVFNKSILSEINKLVTSSGGNLVLFTMPTSSQVQEIYNTDIMKRNENIFKAWARQNDINIITVDNFYFSDEDFPDIAHLSITRRDEFSKLLLKKLSSSHLTPFKKHTRQ
jgi:hypothetical protein